MINNSYSNNSTNINFLGYKSKFSKEFEYFLKTGANDFAQKQSLRQEFPAVIKSKINENHNLGRGRFHRTYKIDDYYVLRISDTDQVKIAQPVKINNVFFKFADIKNYFGKVIAIFGNVEIYKNTFGSAKKGLNAGLPYDLANKAKTFIDRGLSFPKKLSAEVNKSYNKNYLPEFSSLPQKAYNSIAEDFDKLNKFQAAGKHSAKLCFDCNNPNNFIKVGNKIRIVDDLVYDNKMKLSDMMRVFIRDYGAKPTAKSIKMKRNIFDKCMIAGVKNDLTNFINKKYLTDVGIKEPSTVFNQKIGDISHLPKNKKISELQNYLATI